MSDTDLKDPFAEDDAEANDVLKALAPATPSKAPKARLRAADKVARDMGFRESKKAPKPAMRRSANFKTGRNQNMGIRGRIEDKQRIGELCEQQDWVQGQLLQYALDALQEKIKNSEDEFWNERNFHGVE